MNNAKPAVQWLFLDLNAFFASCEQQEAPALRGKPVIVVQTLTDSAVAIAASYAAKAGLRTKFQTLPMLITAGWVARATVIALIGSLLGAFYPAIKAAQKDPIDALAYE